MFGILGSDRFDIHADNGYIVVSVGIAMIFVSSVGVAMRFVARRIAKQPLLMDDWAILLAVPFTWAVCASQIAGKAQSSPYFDDTLITIAGRVAVKLGRFGQHIELATPESVSAFFKCLYVDQLVYAIGITFVKISILLFYRRIFNVSSTKLPAYIIGWTVLAWSLAIVRYAIYFHDAWS